MTQLGRIFLGETCNLASQFLFPFPFFFFFRAARMRKAENKVGFYALFPDVMPAVYQTLTDAAGSPALDDSVLTPLYLSAKLYHHINYVSLQRISQWGARKRKFILAKARHFPSNPVFFF